MSIEEDLALLLKDKETIVAIPILFKEKLGIGDRTYGWIRKREMLTTYSEAVGIGSAAYAAASSSVVATTFFAPTGFLAGLGLVSAATPVGWLIGVGLATGAGYVALSSLLERPKDKHVVVVPKYINTPLDVIALSLIEVMLPMSLKVAMSDGDLDERESMLIKHYYVNQWGYDAVFIERMSQEYLEHLNEIRFEPVADAFNLYLHDNPDCDPGFIINGLLGHLREITQQGDVNKQAETLALKELESLLYQATEPNFVNSTFDGIKSSMSRLPEKASNALGNSAEMTQDYSKKAINKALTTVQMVSATAKKAHDAVSEKLNQTKDDSDNDQD